MEYSKLVAVTGLPGLYELINSKNDGAIIRSLDDKSTRFVSGRSHNFSQLESIEVFTNHDNVNLVDVFNAMEKGGAVLPDEKDLSAIKKYFENVYPDIDFTRVYNSDLKKMVKWFDILKKNKIEIKLSETAEEPPAEEVITETITEKEPEKKKEKASKTKEEISIKKKSPPNKK